MRLLLIRHGQTPANVDGRLNTAAPGPGLTELGERQAAGIPVALQGDVIDGIFVSTLLRTHVTAAPLAADRRIDAVELPGIHEIGAGSLEDRSDRESVHRYHRTAFAWGLGDLDVVMPGGVDGHEFFERFDASIATVSALHESGTAVVVSHGAAIRVWIAGRVTNVPPSFSGDREIDNTGVIELDGNPDDGWVLLSWQGSPVGGSDLADEAALDPTGESLRD
ncbi:putative phosphoglycerate mutase [Salinibacterium sp. CAN_S4]|uniref:histidine phosphatase family protein n=1 Tax=Salinibacterium sp. CAN_S4 TaxID=2787727 RepID=UPI0018F04719